MSRLTGKATALNRVQCEDDCISTAALCLAAVTGRIYRPAERNVSNVISGGQFKRTGTITVPSPALV